MTGRRIQYADDDTESVGLLMRLRMPSLAVGLVLGVLLSFMTSRFEQVLEQNIQIAFFIPFIVYMADAVGTQTQGIYSRDLRGGKASFKKYLFKETLLGIIFGLISSIASALIVLFWLGSQKVALTIALAMFGAVSVAPVVALLVTEVLQLEHRDPAVGSGPIATVIQDAISILIYGLIASAILL